MVAVPRTLATLLDHLIDYAGLFPPAALDMPRAVESYARHRLEPFAWALGRFVVPVSRLSELAAEGHRARAMKDGGCWRLSALAALPLDPDLEAIRRFNARSGDEGNWCGQVETVEVRASTPAEIEEASRATEGLELFVELGLDGPLGELLDATARSGCRAKVRTGGTSPDAFPSAQRLAAFLQGCTRRALPFKATAGLHHAVRSVSPVTGETGAPLATMHGFLNVLAASALLYAGRIDGRGAELLLEDTDASRFRFTGQEMSWGEVRLTDDELAAARRVALGFGSCSFEEPLGELSALGLLGVPTS
ncbi:MAG: hypothetical protein EHM13_04715 [Acidobacteria bacterium]|nr:MAG: hypothetical protein EHM13_04715 [Acidobacteriota bacterium]